MHLPWILHERHFMAHENTVQNCKMKFHGICGPEFPMNIEVFYFMSHELHKKRHSWAMKFPVCLFFELLPLFFTWVWTGSSIGIYVPYSLQWFGSFTSRLCWTHDLLPGSTELLLTEATVRSPSQIAWGEGFSWRTIWTAWEPKNNNTHATHK